MKDTINKRKDRLCAALCALAAAILFLLPTGFDSAAKLRGENEARIAARVIQADNSMVIDTGLVKAGEQACTVELLQGAHKGERYSAVNILSGSLEKDTLYEAGDLALVLVSMKEGAVVSVSAIDHYRLHLELVLLLGFFLLLACFAGWMGLRAILSFLLTLMVIWKLLIPACLRGADPILVGLGVTALLTLCITALVFGFDKRCLAAVSGALAGILVTCGLGVAFTGALNINGAVMSYSESLLYSGYMHLDLTRIFMASIFIGASGAMMDITVDVTAAVYEVVERRPDLSRREAMRSGIRVGRAALGTMTTTLLLAYSGGFLGLLMVFMAQGTPLINILNYKYVSSEIIHTMVGSFGLVAAAPLTALTAGFFLARPQAKTGEENSPAL